MSIAPFAAAVYVSEKRVPAGGSFPLVIEVRNTSSQARTLHTSPIGFEARPLEPRPGVAAKPVTKPTHDIYIQVIVEQAEPVTPPDVVMTPTGLQPFKSVRLAAEETTLLKILVPRFMFTGERCKVSCRLSGDGAEAFSEPVVVESPKN